MKQAVWIIVLVCIGAVTGAMQLDRQSRYSPEWAERVPEPARYFAQAHLAAEALQAQDTDAGADLAEALLSRRPIPAENVRLYAQAQIQSGKPEAGLIGLQVAAQRGWRDPVTQEAMARIAWAAGDGAASANRLAALYARETNNAVLSELAEEVLSSPDGREQMATLLAGPARWEARFVRQARHHTSPETFNAVLLLADEKGARFSCGPLKLAVERQSRDSGEPEENSPLVPLISANC